MGSIGDNNFFSLLNSLYKVLNEKLDFYIFYLYELNPLENYQLDYNNIYMQWGFWNSLIIFWEFIMCKSNNFVKKKLAIRESKIQVQGNF